jgi:predicted RNA-binding Zn-ribbon protein involved in translation (DUF1610 family)
MIYAFKCMTCGARFDSQSRFNSKCPECLNSSVKRDYTTVQFGVQAFRPHFNHAVGSYVTSSRQFDDILKIRGEQAGSSFSRIDPGDVEQIRSHDDILDTQMRTITDRGINPSSLTE